MMRRVLLTCLGAILATIPLRAATTDGSGTNDTSQITNLITQKFDGLTFAAGPSTTGGFGASLNGGNDYMWGPWNVDETQTSGLQFPVFGFVDYSTDDSWNTKSNSLNQLALDLRLGVHGLVAPAVNLQDLPPASGPIHCTTTDGIERCPNPGPGPDGGYGFYGDARYRYGTFHIAKSTKKLNQLLGGGGVYFVWQKGLTAPWVVVWPRMSVTYYVPISTNSSDFKGLLPGGAKANFLQAEFKTGFKFGPQSWVKDRSDTYPFKLLFTYDGSAQVFAKNAGWQSLWNVQLSTDMLESSDGRFKPAISFQSGKNGGLKYDTQILIGLAYELFGT